MVIPRWLWLPTLLQTLLALVLCFVPLFDVLSYEFSFATGLMCAVTAPIIGLGTARSQRGPGLLILARAMLQAVLHLLPGLLLISLNASRVRNCNYLTGLQFFALQPLCTALYGASLGVAVGRWVPQRGRGVVLTAAIATPLLLGLWALYSEPPIFVFDHLWGYFAGSLYDESITIDARLLWFRVSTASRIVAVALALWAWERRPRLGARPVGLLIAAGISGSVVYDDCMGSYAGYVVSRASIAAALPVTLTRPNLVIHLPPGLDSGRQNAIADDHLFRLQALLSQLDITLEQPIHSYVYANADQKARLMGGRGTMVAKPWLHEIHVHNPEAPHPVVPHELAHAVAAAFGSPWLKVSAHHEFFVNMGLVEGFAQAFTPDSDELSLHHWARAMRDLRLNPDMQAILGPAGFWSQAPRRAYTVAGSFVRYLLDTYGAAPLKAAYPGGDFEGAYHKSLAVLVGEWDTFLNSVQVSAREQHVAAERFRSPSIFARPCAHEIAQLTFDAEHSDPQTAVEKRREICTHLANAPAARLELAQALRQAGDVDGFLSLTAELLAQKELNAVQQAELLQARSDVQWQQNRHGEARDSARAVLNLQISLAAERLAWVRLWAIDLTPGLNGPVLEFLAGRLPAVAAVLMLDKAARADPGDKTYAYLIARQLYHAGSYEAALTYLRAAGPHPFSPLESERLRLTGDCHGRLGQFDAAINAFTTYQGQALTSGEAAVAADWLARWAWQKRAAP